MRRYVVVGNGPNGWRYRSAYFDTATDAAQHLYKKKVTAKPGEHYEIERR